jgi:putative DNA modification/repair radical SAM protein
MNTRTIEKLSILADAAKYDVSCSSSGSKRKNENGGLGNATGMGICHAYTEDGRCVSLLKILLTNHCIYDCAYCISRKSNDVRRAAFTIEEVVELTISFYRRNYIEGLFLSSGIFKNADYTMERLVKIAQKLRTEHRFNGYIHLKAIPGASQDLLHQAGLYADRLSMNIEMPTKEGLALLAPDKKREDMVGPMKYLKHAISVNEGEKVSSPKSRLFLPAGQSTQMIVGATKESDWDVLGIASAFYQKMKLKRVYYSGYVPVSNDKRLPSVGTPVPFIRENRLYQADWLLRFYGFKVEDLLSSAMPQLEMEIDPKLSWALRNMHDFPVDINSADYQLLIKVPGLGLESARKICKARRFGRLNWGHLKKMGVMISKVRYFLIADKDFERKDWQAEQIRSFILNEGASKYKATFSKQLQLF